MPQAVVREMLLVSEPEVMASTAQSPTPATVGQLAEQQEQLEQVPQPQVVAAASEAEALPLAA